MKQKEAIVIIGALILVGVGGYFIASRQQVSTVPLPEITDFEACDRAGYPVGESYPRQCWTPDGKRFVEEIDQGSPPPPGLVTIENISPSSGSIGTQIIIGGSGFSTNDNDIAFTHPAINFQGRTTAYVNHVASQDGKTLSFNLPNALGACAYSRLNQNEACPEIGILLPKGVAQISVVNKNGISNSLTFTVK